MDDAALLRAYVTNRSEAAITELVRRHLALVYFAALRRTNGDAHLAEDIAQKVFITLARQAAGCQSHATLSGWLYVTTRHAAANAMRDRQRQSAREREAMKMQATVASPDPETDWVEIRPELDEAMDTLNDRDRTAVLLRFFENKSFAEIGATLRISADAARMRTERALDKLRTLLSRRGITSTSAALALVLEQQAGLAAPAALSASIPGAVLAGAATAGATTGAVTGSFLFMSTSKLIAGITGGMAALAMGTAIYEAKQAKDAQTTIAVLRAQLAAETVRNASVQGLGRPAKPDQALTTGEKANVTRSIAAVDSARTDDYVKALPKRRARLHRQFDPFIAQHGLSSVQADKLIALLIARDDVYTDLKTALRENGLPGDNAEARVFREELLVPINQGIKGLLGDIYYDFNDYETGSFYRVAYIEPLLPAAAATGTPLTEVQIEQFGRILMANTHVGPPINGNADPESHVDWPSALKQAAPIFTPEQNAALAAEVSRRNPKGS
jgi:RNA polymerase sigma factor (sigma-70 family)